MGQALPGFSDYTLGTRRGLNTPRRTNAPSGKSGARRRGTMDCVTGAGANGFKFHQLGILHGARAP